MVKGNDEADGMTLDQLMYAVMSPLATYYRAKRQLESTGQPEWRQRGANTRKVNARDKFAKLIEEYIDSNKEPT